MRLNFFKKNHNPVFKNIFFFWCKINKNKNFEFQVYYYFEYFLTLNLEFLFKGKDHAGPKIEFSIFGLNFDIIIYDRRHWSHTNNDWL